MQANTTFSETNLLSSLTRNFLVLTNNLKPTLDSKHTSTLALLTFIENLLKLFIQIYMDTVKN